MQDLAERLSRYEDRMAVQDVLLAYYTAVDSLDDLDGLLACFAEDAVFDLTSLGLKRIQGHAAIGDFFRVVFADMTHHCHLVTNIRPQLAGDQAHVDAYVMGMGMAKSGTDVLVYCYLDIDYVRADGGWKISSFVEGAQMALPAEVGEIHDRG